MEDEVFLSVPEGQCPVTGGWLDTLLPAVPAVDAACDHSDSDGVHNCLFDGTKLTIW